MRNVILGAVLATLLGGCTPKSESSATAGKEAAGEGGHEDHTEGEEEGHQELIKLTAEAVRNAGIEVAPARRRGLSSGLVAPARLSFPQKGVGRVAARVPGRLVSLEVTLGQQVAKGQVLGYLESPELSQSRADYLSAATKARVAEGNFRREKELLAKGITSEREMREAESTHATAQAEMNAAESRLHALGLSDAEIRALKADEHYSSRFPARSPLAGTVVEISVTEGQVVEGATPLFTVGDLSQLWVLVDVYEAQLAAVRVGAEVSVSVSAYPERRFAGRVEYIGDLVDEKTRAVPVRVIVPNTDRSLKPGMFATAEIAIQVAADAGMARAGDSGTIVLPRDAVQTVGEEHVVFVAEPDNGFRPVEVRTGKTSAREVEILSGLQPGASVVVRGAFILKSELSKESMGEGHSH